MSGDRLRVLDDGRAVAGTADDNVYLWTFDSQSGAEVADRITVGLFYTHNYGGLWCGTPTIAP